MCSVLFGLYQNILTYLLQYFWGQEIAETAFYESSEVLTICNNLKIIYLNPLWNSDRMGNAFLTTFPSKFCSALIPNRDPAKTLLLLQTQIWSFCPTIASDIAVLKVLQLSSSQKQNLPPVTATDKVFSHRLTLQAPFPLYQETYPSEMYCRVKSTFTPTPCWHRHWGLYSDIRWRVQVWGRAEGERCRRREGEERGEVDSSLL